METFKFLLVGGGMVNGYALKEMAKLGLAAGDACLLSDEGVPPYKRPDLSKDLHYLLRLWDTIQAKSQKASAPALIYEEREEAISKRTMYEISKREHRLFKVIAPWKWPFPWRRPGEGKAKSGEGGSP